MPQLVPSLVRNSSDEGDEVRPLPHAAPQNQPAVNGTANGNRAANVNRHTHVNGDAHMNGDTQLNGTATVNEAVNVNATVNGVGEGATAAAAAVTTAVPPPPALAAVLPPIPLLEGEERHPFDRMRDGLLGPAFTAELGAMEAQIHTLDANLLAEYQAVLARRRTEVINAYRGRMRAMTQQALHDFHDRLNAPLEPPPAPAAGAAPAEPTTADPDLVARRLPRMVELWRHAARAV